MSRKLREPPRPREVELVIDGLGAVRLEVQSEGSRGVCARYRYGTDRNLHKHGQPLPRRRRVGHYNLAAVNGLNNELLADKFVGLFAIHLTVSVARAVEVLAHEHRQ